MDRRLLFALPVAVFLAISAMFAVGLWQDPAVLPSALLDQPAPDFDLPPLFDDGLGLSRLDLVGQVSLVNVFASWCGPCRLEHPLLMDLAASGEVAVYGLNYKNAPAEARQWLAALGDPYARIGVDLDGRAGIEWGVYGVPETFVVDGDGMIRFKHVGPLDPDVLERTILPLVRRLRR